MSDTDHEARREIERARLRARYAARTPEQIERTRVRQRANYLANRDAYLARAHDWCARNRERHNAINRDHQRRRAAEKKKEKKSA